MEARTTGGIPRFHDGLFDGAKQLTVKGRGGRSKKKPPHRDGLAIFLLCCALKRTARERAV
jgi:hypothetical protein